MFRVYQKVLCVTSPANMGYGDEIMPTVGEIYTIRDIRPSLFRESAVAVVHLAEIRNDHRVYRMNDAGYEAMDECWFRSNHFRPLVSKTTSIEIFRKLLTPSLVPA